MKKYVIGDKVFYHKKLVLIQTRCLMKELVKLGISSENSGEAQKAEVLKKILDVSGDGMPRILGCLLVEEGKLFPKNEQEFSEHVQFIDNNIDIDLVTEILQDFLVQSQMPKTNSSSDEISKK